jgi:hypothetical protein
MTGVTGPGEDNPVASAGGTPIQAFAFTAGLAGIALGYLGVGLPQHFYQPLFAALMLALVYRHRRVQLAPGGWRWPLVVVHFLLLCLLFKLLIGGGVSYPFGWMKVPGLDVLPAPDDAHWYERMVPRVEVVMKGIPNITDWSIDITRLQTLLLVATLFGAVTGFQPFASLTALALLVVSLPTFSNFNWDWVLLFLLSGGASFYLQSPFETRKTG